MNLFMKDLPNHIKKEIDKLQEVLHPISKKITRYSIWTFPLIAVSIFNLAGLFLFGQVNQESAPMILFLAIMGAIGMALYKEIKIQRKEIKKLSAEYMVERIKNSEVANEYRKKEYIALIQEQSINKMIAHFIHFLNEEDRRKNMMS
ncbi:hypothetical protein SAMN05192533_101453 [Mesobacillus persicus]|uniref:Uncharacterized protein n=1 Tax=Mesobacillus persicus TaxID=930146 RepID=A0A1H7WKV1_9BACI|nr:DUF5392 family protein [Mesobacillus persicus]SEM21649.1 hypothetical protein SAMN05192533_101453 [Mesobacillus persicus]